MSREINYPVFPTGTDAAPLRLSTTLKCWYRSTGPGICLKLLKFGHIVLFIITHCVNHYSFSSQGLVIITHHAYYYLRHINYEIGEKDKANSRTLLPYQV